MKYELYEIYIGSFVPDEREVVLFQGNLFPIYITRSS